MWKFVILLIALQSLSLSAHACSCAVNGTPREHIDSSAFVSFGINLSARVIGPGEAEDLFAGIDDVWVPENMAVARFKATIPIKGVKKGEIVKIYYEADGSNCSMAPVVGFEHVLFVDEYHGHYFAFSCSNEWRAPAEKRDEFFRLFEELSGHDFPGIN